MVLFITTMTKLSSVDDQLHCAYITTVIQALRRLRDACCTNEACSSSSSGGACDHSAAAVADAMSDVAQAVLAHKVSIHCTACILTYTCSLYT
jgi:hypothetical protein